LGDLARWWRPSAASFGDSRRSLAVRASRPGEHEPALVCWPPVGAQLGLGPAGDRFGRRRGRRRRWPARSISPGLDAAVASAQRGHRGSVRTRGLLEGGRPGRRAPRSPHVADPHPAPGPPATIPAAPQARNAEGGRGGSEGGGPGPVPPHPAVVPHLVHQEQASTRAASERHGR